MKKKNVSPLAIEVSSFKVCYICVSALVLINSYLLSLIYSDFDSWDTWHGATQNSSIWRGSTAASSQSNRRKKAVTFSTRYSCSVFVANASKIEDYMTLPFDQYSLLDQSFISRVQGNVFRFMVPANELVGLQTVPIVDVKVDVDGNKKVLAITSISSRLVSRSSDGTILGTQDVGLLSNNSLSFSTTISWGEKRQALGSGRGPRANLARLGARIFQPSRAGTAATGAEGTGRGVAASSSKIAANLLQDDATNPIRLMEQMEQELGGGSTVVMDDNSLRIETRPTTETAGTGAATKAGSVGGKKEKKRKLTCTAKIDVGVVVPPPFSLLPGLVLRRGASIVLSTLVASLINRFLDLLIEDFYKWEQGEGRTEGSLLGYQPERYADRVIETDAANLILKEDEDDVPPPPPPPPEYVI